VSISAQDILEAKNKFKWDYFADICIKEPKSLKFVVETMLDGKSPHVQRAAAILTKVQDKRKRALLPFIEPMIQRLQSPAHDAVIRNIFRLFQIHDFSINQEARVMDIAFLYFQDPESAIAIKVFSMTTLVRLAKKYPDLLNEIKAIVKDQKPYMSKGMLSRSRSLGLLS